MFPLKAYKSHHSPVKMQTLFTLKPLPTVQDSVVFATRLFLIYSQTYLFEDAIDWEYMERWEEALAIWACSHFYLCLNIC